MSIRRIRLFRRNVKVQAHKYNKMRQAITELRAVVKVLNENQFDGKFQENFFFFDFQEYITTFILLVTF